MGSSIFVLPGMHALSMLLLLLQASAGLYIGGSDRVCLPSDTQTQSWHADHAYQHPLDALCSSPHQGEQ